MHQKDALSSLLPAHDSFNPFPHDKILDQTKLKAFADDKLNVTKMIIYVFDRVENIVGKGEIACTSNFSFSHNFFQKASFSDPSKGVIVSDWVKCYLKLLVKLEQNSTNYLTSKSFMLIPEFLK